MDMTRRNVLKLTAAVGSASLCAPAIASAKKGKFTYKFATGQAPTHPVNLRLKEAFGRIQDATHGDMVINLFPANQLGTETDIISQMRNGALEFAILTASILATISPACGMANTAYAFISYDDVWKAMDGELGSYMRQELAKVGLAVNGKIWDNGFRQCTSSDRDLQKPADFSGFKVRVPPSPILTSFFTAIGASPTPMNFSEVYSSLQTKVIEGQENSISLVQTTRLYEVQKYCALTGHSWDGYWPMANPDYWAQLPDDFKTLISDELDRSAIDQRADIASLDQSLKAKLVQEGMTIRDIDKQGFKAALSKTTYYRDWKEKYGEDAWGKLEAVVGKLA